MTLIQGVVNTFVIFISVFWRSLPRVLWAEIVMKVKEQRQPADLLCGCNGSGTGVCILASIITMWFSRHREFHADAVRQNWLVARK